MLYENILEWNFQKYNWEQSEKIKKESWYDTKTLAEKLQLEGRDFTDLTILRIEQGKRFVPDYEVVALAEFFGITTDDLLKGHDE